MIAAGERWRVNAFVNARVKKAPFPYARQHLQIQHRKRTSHSMIKMAQKDNQIDKADGKLPVFLDLETRGGVLFFALMLFVLPLLGYSVATNVFQVDELEAGKWIGGGFTAVFCIGWASTLLLRVVNKDMTYAKQLKDYENAVLEKRLEELDDDEQQALLEDIKRDGMA